MKIKILPYKPYLKKIAKKLRQNMTLSEVLLWDHLKQKRMLGQDFDRQKPILKYIVDFYCKDLMLAIEIDGKSHDSEASYRADQIRQKEIEKLGVSFLRFDDTEVKKDINNVLRSIEYWIEDKMKQVPTPTPLPGGDSSEATRSRENPLLGGAGVGLKNHLQTAQKACLEAGKKILEIYHSEDFNIQLKGDNSPLTKADKAAHNVICQYLEKTDLPILSEEGRNIPFAERKNWEYFWMIDPLDGTKEFIKRNDEFTVNIALISKDKSILGVVYAPVLNKLYFAIEGKGAFLIDNLGEAQQIKTNEKYRGNTRIVASRSHLNEETQNFINSFSNPEIVSLGSSLKFLVIAEGNAEYYPRFAPTMEWDTAAAQIIVEEAGGSVVKKNTNYPMRYNKKNLLNPDFLASAK